jgi:hypothetical protein
MRRSRGPRDRLPRTDTDLVPVDDYKGCHEKTLASVIRSAKAPLITRLYLSTHAFEEAVAQGIYGQRKWPGGEGRRASPEDNPAAWARPGTTCRSVHMRISTSTIVSFR